MTDVTPRPLAGTIRDRKDELDQEMREITADRDRAIERFRRSCREAVFWMIGLSVLAIFCFLALALWLLS